MSNVKVFETPDLLAKGAADFLLTIADQAIKDHGKMSIALSGGTTPKRLFQLLASSPYKEDIDWTRWHLFFGDERCVPHDHKDSNYRMARETLLDVVHAPHVYPIPTDATPQDNAKQYASMLTDQLGTPAIFDLIFLGLGGDGHTASLFPDTGAIEVSDRDAIAVYVEKLQSWRISLSLPLINHAKQVVFLVEGEGKADIIKEIIQDQKDCYPAEHVKPQGELHWFLDQQAATKL